MRIPAFFTTAVLIMALVALVSCSEGEDAPTAPAGPTVGNLAISVSGLPGGTDADLSLNGPGGFTASVTASQSFPGMQPGTYTLSATPVTSATASYAPSPATQDIQVVVGQQANASVSYTLSSGTDFNLSVFGAYLVQATQRLTGTVPLVSDRDAYLRVFVRGSEATTQIPGVRVHLYHGGELSRSIDIVGSMASLGVIIDEGDFDGSFNVLIPAADVRPGLSFTVDVDPGGAIPENNEGDNQFPGTGSPFVADVRATDALEVRFIPVHQSVNGLTGNVNAGNMEAFIEATRTLYPISRWNCELLPSYTTSAPELQANNGNDAWGMIVNEVLALRSAQDGDLVNYYGVVKTTYNSGVAGVGYVPPAPDWGTMAAIGWDNLPSASSIAAHELGHNFGRSHAPCGSAGGPDPAYPYAGGSIGVYGLDPRDLQVFSPAQAADLMGYCSPEWISDYTYEAVLDFRAPLSNLVSKTTGVDTECLLIWGRIVGGRAVLEPAFRVVTRPKLPLHPGDHRVELVDSDGRSFLSFTFDGVPLADVSGGTEEHFAFAIPVDPGQMDRLATLRLSGTGAHAERSASPSAFKSDGQSAVAPVFGTTAMASDGVRLEWDASVHPMVLVRDADSGQILSFARGGRVELRTQAQRLELGFSNGVAQQVQAVQLGTR